MTISLSGRDDPRFWLIDLIDIHTTGCSVFEEDLKASALSSYGAAAKHES